MYIPGEWMENLGFPGIAIQRARRLLVACGVMMGSLSCLAALLLLVVPSENPTLILPGITVIALGLLGLPVVALVSLYRGIPSVQEKKEIEQRLSQVSSELEQAQKDPQLRDRVPAVQHRKQRIQAQFVPYQELSFASYLRIVVTSLNTAVIKVGALFISLGGLAACCAVGYSLLAASDSAADVPPVDRPHIGLAVSPSAAPIRLTATPTNSVTATVLPTRTASITSTPVLFTAVASTAVDFTAVPSATATMTPLPAQVVAGSACLQGTPQEADLLSVLDGDTIEVRLLEDQQVYRLRYIGIDSPESGAPFAAEAAAANARMVAGQLLLLFRDVSQVDRYGRLLRYVVAGEIFVNYELTRQGLASPVNFPPDEACASTFLQAEGDARADQAGWYAPGVVNPFSPAGSAPAGGEGGSRPGCSPAYPDICLPPPPPDLDCADVPARRFRVLPPDPHHFDGDGDGIGCKS